MKTATVKTYYSALQEQFKLQSSVLTDVLPHSGERGRNDEERFREFLGRVLPRKYSVGSGFVVCSDAGVPPSSQTDVVLFDEFHNSPLHRELAAQIYPVEIVYGTVEVKGRLEKRELAKIIEDIGKMRALGRRRHYMKYQPVQKPGARRDAPVVGHTEVVEQLPPRAFVFAYEQKGWSSLSDFVDSLREANTPVRAHIHGLAVLDSDWHVAQEAYADDPPRYVAAQGDALLRFMNGMLYSIGSYAMRQMSIDRYYGQGA